MKIASFFRPTDPRVTYEPGEVIFSSGDDGHEMFGVLDGAVELRDGDRVVERLGVDGVFGEMALVDHAPRNLTVVAVEASQLAVIDERLFKFLVHESPTFAIEMMGALAARIRSLNHPET